MLKTLTLAALMAGVSTAAFAQSAAELARRQYLQQQSAAVPAEGEERPAVPYLGPDEEASLERYVRRLDDVERVGLDILSEGIFDQGLTQEQKAALIDDASDYYAALSQPERVAMVETRRIAYREMSPQERSDWRYAKTEPYVGLLESQKNIFRFRALQRFDSLTGPERNRLLDRAAEVVAARATEANSGMNGASAVSNLNAPTTSKAVYFLTREEKLQFRTMTPEQQKAYLEQAGKKPVVFPSEEERLRFQSMTPDQQRLYLDQLGYDY